jgi:phosphohistidine phosphatase
MGVDMRQLLLLRHAKSTWDDASMPDRDRPLNARGRRSAAAMRLAMRNLGLSPDVVLVSTARRTMETLEALEPWDDAPLIDPVDSLYLANLMQLTAALHGVAETVRSVLLIGHNPGLHDLALNLAGDQAMRAGGKSERALADGFPTGALAEFVVPGSWWDLRAGGGRLVRFLTPRMLEGAGSS